MADLFEILPNFDIKPYSHLLHSLEKNEITVAELISLDPAEIARRCPLPLLDVQALIQEIIQTLQHDVKVQTHSTTENTGITNIESFPNRFNNIWSRNVGLVTTLDESIDKLLGGGFVTGHVSEIVGESAVGKTQFVLGLLLSVQLDPPNGLGKSAIYLSTEAGLNTTRLNQMLSSNPIFEALPPKKRPTLDHVHTLSTNDLEAQEHILQYQLPIAVKRFNVGLIVMDSIAANFRAERETKTFSALADRAAELTKLGSLLRRIAIEHSLAVVVTNQVSDRFDENNIRLSQDRLYSSSPSVSSTPKPASQLVNMARRKEVLTLDHQQRFFTGWGNQINSKHELKTPTLGLAWANQISTRIALKIESERSLVPGTNIWKHRKRRRFMSIVFSPWAESTILPLEYWINTQGIASMSSLAIPDDGKADERSGLNNDLLHSDLWVQEDEEFP